MIFPRKEGVLRNCPSLTWTVIAFCGCAKPEKTKQMEQNTPTRMILLRRVMIRLRKIVD